MAMQYVVVHQGVGPIAVTQIAEEFNIPSELLAKILQRLAKRRLIVGHSDPKGGYRLASKTGGAHGRASGAGVGGADRDCYLYLNSTTLDYVQQGLQAGFTFVNANAKSTCWCGTSFSA